MVTLMVLAGVLALFAAVVHGSLGTRVILGPTLAAGLSPVVRATQHGAWHVITWHFVVLGVAALVGAWRPGPWAEAIAWMIAASAAGHAVIMFVTGWRHFGDPWHLPQWVIFAPMAAASVAAVRVGAGDGVVPAVAAAAVAAALLAAIGVLHLVWAAGSPFPARSRDALVVSVVGAPAGAPMPGRIATVVVGVGLLLMAWWVAAQGGLIPSPMPRRWLAGGSLAIAIIFGIRGIGGFFGPALRPSIRGTPYQRYSRVLYSPLALGIATLVSCAML